MQPCAAHRGKSEIPHRCPLWLTRGVWVNGNMSKCHAERYAVMWLERKACPTGGLASLLLFSLSLLAGKWRVPIRFSVVAPPILDSPVSTQHDVAQITSLWHLSYQQNFQSQFKGLLTFLSSSFPNIVHSYKAFAGWNCSPLAWERKTNQSTCKQKLFC